MQFPKLTPLQSRFAASLTASCVLIVIYLFLWSPKFAYAAELGGPSVEETGLKGGDGDDHNWARIVDVIEDWVDELDGVEDERVVSGGVEEQGRLQKRLDVSTLGGNNQPGQLNINPGETHVWLFSNSSVWANYTDAGPGLPSTNYELEDGTDDDGTFFRKLKARDLDDEQGLHKRQSSSAEESRRVYISINTCLQPGWNNTSPQVGEPPQLTLYISNDTSNIQPGPNVTNGTQVELRLDEGFANYSMNATREVYMSVTADDLPTNFTGVWNYELAASIDDYYHGSWSTTFLHLVDTDTTNALLVTDNLTQASAGDKIYEEWMNLTTPFIVFAQNQQDKSIAGVKNSFCGLKTAPAQIVGNIADPEGVTDSVQMGMITRGLGNKPKEQFYIKGLNASSSYDVYLAMQGNSSASGAGVVGGGGQVWASTVAKTKQDGNCQLIFNLAFCSEVAYAVPSNPYTFPSIDSLAAVYDSYAAGLYQNFNYSLQQIPCNTTSSAQYSLAKTCDDCASAYKTWLCAVTMPRCEDFSSTLPWLQPRNMAQRFLNASVSASGAVGNQPPSNSSQYLEADLLNQNYIPMSSAPGDSAAFSQTYASVFASNSSRNPAVIDEQIEPGPYKEVLPCDDLCYAIVQSCPAAFGFACPDPGRGLEVDYGKRSSGSDLTCSYLGAVYYLNSAPGLTSASVGRVAVVVAGIVGAVLFLA